MIIRSLRELREFYHQLGPGDAFVGELSFRPGEELKAVDLLHRQVLFFPSLLSQFLSRSKILQAEVLGPYMIPDTFVAYRGQDLCRNLTRYSNHGQIICKQDRKHLGMGLSRWSSLEELQNLNAINALPYPLVIQPFLSEVRDFRVIMTDDHCEAYERINYYSFRKNLAQNATSRPVELTSPLKEFCLEIMRRGDFPYALLDILTDSEQNYYLSEITLHGGLTGSLLGQNGYLQIKKRMQDRFCRQHQAATLENQSINRSIP